jgi:tripartite-type tricarboxylate transporter receptor subunit TctC
MARMIRMVLTLCFVLAGIVGATAQAPAPAGWPDRPIRFIVPFPAGAVTDIVARVVTTRLADRLGQPVVVENRVGGSGTIGGNALALAPPDGYTIGLATSTTHAITAALKPGIPYDSLKDFAPVAMIGVSPYALVVNAGVPAKNVEELIALAKAKPRALNYSSVGPGSLAHLAGELFCLMTGVELTHVPYRSASHAVIDLNAGRIEIQFSALGVSLPYAREGKLRLLAVTSPKRATAAPDVPTLQELGLKDYDATLWIAIAAPAAVPPAIVARLNKEVGAVLAEPDVVRALALQAIDVAPSTPDELRELMRRDFARWRDLGAKTGIRVE